MFKVLACVTVLLFNALFISSSHAEMILYGAVTSGGDTLATAFDEDGDEIVDLKAGGLFHQAVGYEQPLGGGGIRLTLGLKLDWLEAEDGDARITRFPLEATAYWRFAERHAIGGGLVYEIAPVFEIDIDGFGSSDVNFDDALGGVIYYGFSITDRLEVGLRHTLIEYETDLLPVVDADNTGLFVRFSL